MLIIDRLKEAIDKGLTPTPAYEEKVVKTIGDLTIPYDEFFDEGSSYCQTPYKGKRPSIKARPLTATRRIPPPKKLTAPPRFYPANSFNGVKAVWEYYQAKGTAHKKYLDLPANHRGLVAFVSPFLEELDHPLGSHIDCIEDMDDLFYLTLPSMSYDEDVAGLFEAFLTGPDEVAGMLMHYDEDEPLRLNKKDRALVKKHGLVKLTNYYATYEGPKHCDLDKMQNWYDVFFGELEKKYPEQKVDHVPLISGDGYYQIEITCKKDIDFAMEFADISENLYASIPNIWAMEGRESEEVEDFVVNICDVWREGHKK